MYFDSFSYLITLRLLYKQFLFFRMLKEDDLELKYKNFINFYLFIPQCHTKG